MALDFIHRQEQKTFVLNRTLHVTKDGEVVEEDDVRSDKVLGGKGKAFYEDEAKALGLNESHREGGTAEPAVEPAPVPVTTAKPAAKPAPKKAAKQ